MHFVHLLGDKEYLQIFLLKALGQKKRFLPLFLLQKHCPPSPLIHLARKCQSVQGRAHVGRQQPTHPINQRYPWLNHVTPVLWPEPIQTIPDFTILEPAKIESVDTMDRVLADVCAELQVPPRQQPQLRQIFSLLQTYLSCVPEPGIAHRVANHIFLQPILPQQCTLGFLELVIRCNRNAPKRAWHLHIAHPSPVSKVLSVSVALALRLNPFQNYHVADKIHLSCSENANEQLIFSFHLFQGFPRSDMKTHKIFVLTRRCVDPRACCQAIGMLQPTNLALQHVDLLFLSIFPHSLLYYLDCLVNTHLFVLLPREHRLPLTRVQHHRKACLNVSDTASSHTIFRRFLYIYKYSEYTYVLDNYFQQYLRENFKI